MRQDIPAKKNLFIFGSYPDMFLAEDTFLIIWIRHILKIRNINIFFIDDQGELKGILLNRKHSGDEEAKWELRKSKSEIVKVAVKEYLKIKSPEIYKYCL